MHRDGHQQVEAHRAQPSECLGIVSIPLPWEALLGELQSPSQPRAEASPGDTGELEARKTPSPSSPCLGPTPPHYDPNVEAKMQKRALQVAAKMAMEVK